MIEPSTPIHHWAYSLMTVVAQNVPETYETIVRPVVADILNQLALITNLGEDLRIIYPGQTDANYQPGSTLTPTGDSGNTFESQPQLLVKVEEEYVEDRVINTATIRNENIRIFNDPELDVTMAPVYTHNELVIECTFRGNNQAQVKKFRDDIKVHRSQGRVENLHEVAYSYGIPLKFFTILAQIYQLRQNVMPYADTYQTWFNANVSPKATVVTNLAGNNPNVVIGETQIGIVGWFDFLVAPEAETKAVDTGALDVRFNYHIRFDKPIEVVLRYPVMIHNQILDVAYRGDGRIYQPANRLRSPSWSRFLFDRFTSLYPIDISGIDGVQVPIFDDWVPPSVYPFTSSIMTIMLQVDLTNPMDILNLTNLGDYTVDPDVIQFLYGEAPYMNQYLQSIIHLSLYENGTLLGDQALTIDNQLNVSSVQPMDPRKIYHLRISAMNDLLILNPAAQLRLRLAGQACLKILAMLEQKLPGGLKLPTLVGGQIVSKEDLLAAGQSINSLKIPLKSTIEFVFMQTVGNFLITALKRE